MLGWFKKKSDVEHGKFLQRLEVAREQYRESVELLEKRKKEEKGFVILVIKLVNGQRIDMVFKNEHSGYLERQNARMMMPGGVRIQYKDDFRDYVVKIEDLEYAARQNKEYDSTLISGKSGAESFMHNILFNERNFTHEGITYPFHAILSMEIKE